MLTACLLYLWELGLPGEGRDLSCLSGKFTVYKRYPDNWGTQPLKVTPLGLCQCWINLAVLYLWVPLVSFRHHSFYVGHVVSPFDLSWTLPVDGCLLVPCSLTGPHVVKQRMQIVTWCLARVGGLSQCASPNNFCIPISVLVTSAYSDKQSPRT